MEGDRRSRRLVSTLSSKIKANKVFLTCSVFEGDFVVKRKHRRRFRAQDGSLEITLNLGNQTTKNALVLGVMFCYIFSYSEIVEMLDVFRVVFMRFCAILLTCAIGLGK
jgi:hypothetical protein